MAIPKDACRICHHFLVPVKKGYSQVVLTSCYHLFHKICINAACLKNNVCPLCNRINPVSPKDAIPSCEIEEYFAELSRVPRQAPPLQQEFRIESFREFEARNYGPQAKL